MNTVLNRLVEWFGRFVFGVALFIAYGGTALLLLSFLFPKAVSAYWHWIGDIKL